MTSENSPERDLFGTELPLTRSAAAFRAKTSALPDWALASKARDLASGASTPALLANYDHATSSWRTSQRSFLGGWEEFSATWPRSGTMRSGIAFLLPPLVRLTDETAYGLWPTPMAKDTGLTTDLDKIQARREAVKAKGINGNGFGLSLGEASRLFPTPRTTGLDGGSNSRKAAKERGRWPTPNTGMEKHSTKDAYWLNRVEKGRQEDLQMAVFKSEGSGSLNPTWVEWLMGFPLGWTDLKDSETPSSRKSRKSSVAR